MMRCDECQFWDTKEGKHYSGGLLGLCSKTMPFWDASEWQDTDDFYGRVLLPQFTDLLAFVQDGSDFRAMLLTKPEFFCAHFKATGDTPESSDG